MRIVTASLVAALLSVSVAAQSPSATLAPTGTLRAVFLGSNPVHGRVDPKTGAAAGTVPDLVKEMARRLAVPFSVAPAPDAAGVIAALKTAQRTSDSWRTTKRARAKWTSAHRLS
jgi:hypothetical protein